MAHHGEQYGTQTDEYGNPIHRPAGAEEYGTHGGLTGEYGATHGGGIVGAGTTGAVHRRSGSSSSSSSEDDGQGGRRKKGLKEKIKEKLPGGGHKDEQQVPGYEQEQPEKKGMMEKIKEKLPGHH